MWEHFSVRDYGRIGGLPVILSDLSSLHKSGAMPMYAKRLSLILTIALLPGLFPLSAQAQNDAAEEGEVIVIAELNRREVRQFIAEAEDQLYAIFNANNEDDEYDIECFSYKPTDSNISQRACEPRFFTDARADNAKNSFEATDEMLPLDALRAEYEEEFEELTRKMQAMASDNAQFAQVANILNQLRARQQQLDNN